MASMQTLYIKNLKKVSENRLAVRKGLKDTENSGVHYFGTKNVFNTCDYFALACEYFRSFKQFGMIPIIKILRWTQLFNKRY